MQINPDSNKAQSQAVLPKSTDFKVKSIGIGETLCLSDSHVASCVPSIWIMKRQMSTFGLLQLTLGSLWACVVCH